MNTHTHQSLFPSRDSCRCFDPSRHHNCARKAQIFHWGKHKSFEKAAPRFTEERRGRHGGYEQATRRFLERVCSVVCQIKEMYQLE